MSDMVTTGAVRNRPVITFTNKDTNTAVIDVAIAKQAQSQLMSRNADLTKS